MNATISTMLTILQILVGFATLGALVFYMGKHSARMDRAEIDIVGLAADDKVLASEVGTLHTRTSVLESLVSQTSHGRESSHHG